MINCFQILGFIKHFFLAKNRHGIHSPFVYRLIDKVLYVNKPDRVYNKLEKIRSKLLSDKRLITVHDLGAGSHINHKNTRKIENIAKHILKKPKLAQLIYRITKDCDPQMVIDLGTSLGITTSYIGEAAPHAHIISIEGCPEISKIAEEVIQEAEVKNVQLLTGNFDNLLPKVLQQISKVDLIFIDGNHTMEATLSYFRQSLDMIHEKSILIFDDIYWSRAMQNAWQQIKNHDQVTITIDLFWIGLVFFKKDQAKEHFRIRM